MPTIPAESFDPSPRSDWEGATNVVFDVATELVDQTVAILAGRGYDAVPYYRTPDWDLKPGGAGRGRRRMKIEVRRLTPADRELQALDRELVAALADIPAAEIVAHENWEAT